MLLMIFVNELAGVRGLPWWNYHLPASANGMTYVDMVFPTFLFIVGLSLSLAINRRLSKGQSHAELWIHIISRTMALLTLGIALANADKCVSLSPNVWGLLVLLSGILFWINNSRFRYVGLAGLIILFAVFRRAGGRWLDFSYWEILGLIGWSYLICCALYVPFRRWKYTPAVMLVATAAYASNPRLWAHDYAAFSLLIFAGIVCAQILLSNDFSSILIHKLRLALLFAVVMLAAGLAFLPFGISKIRATPTWCFFTASAATLIFLLLYYICDINGHTRWAAFAKGPGSNTILTYLLPDLYYFAVAVPWIPEAFNFGLLGAIRALVFTGLMLALSAWLTKLNIRMQL